MSPELAAFCDFFSSLDNAKLPKLSEVYSDDVSFIDPVHQVAGLDDLIAYMTKLCGNLISCRFVFHSHSENPAGAWLVWTMYYAHPKIAGGKELSLDGSTELRFKGDKVCYHKDFYDMGAMLYEHIPVIGGLIRYIKLRLSQ